MAGQSRHAHLTVQLLSRLCSLSLNVMFTLPRTLLLPILCPVNSLISSNNLHWSHPSQVIPDHITVL